MPEEHGWQRRVALQLATQLPENREDAYEVLRLLNELAQTFLWNDQAPLPAAAGDVVAFPAVSSSRCNGNASVSVRPR